MFLVPAQTPLDNHFTYQGQIKQNGSPVSGTCDFIFALFGIPVGGTPIGSPYNVFNIPLANGVFAVHLEFYMLSDAAAEKSALGGNAIVLPSTRSTSFAESRGN